MPILKNQVFFFLAPFPPRADFQLLLKITQSVNQYGKTLEAAIFRLAV